APLRECLPDAARDVFEHLVPADALPLAPAPRPDALHRVANALRVLDLVQGRRTLRAVPPAAPRMLRVPLELLDRQPLLVHVGEEPAPCLAVEADGGDELVAAPDASRPPPRVVFLPVFPALDGGIARETPGRRRQILRRRMKRLD